LDIIQAVESTVNLTNSVFNNLNAVGQTEVIYVESAALFFISNCQFLSANIDYVFQHNKYNYHSKFYVFRKLECHNERILTFILSC
jgi:hypothetical protein